MLRRRNLLAAAPIAAASASLPRFAIAQADTRPVITIAVQDISTSNTLEMLREQSNVGTRIFRNFVEPLIDTDWLGDMGQVPGLATSWHRVDDRTLELKLREGVLFHDGTPFTAEDVAFTFGKAHMWGGAEGPRNPIPAAIATARRAFPDFEKVEIVDAHTVRFVNKVPDLILEGRLARSLAVIVSKTAFESAPSWMDWARAPVGTGPYRIAEFRPDQRLVLTAFDQHWAGRPPIRELRFVVVPEVASRLNMLFSGEADFASDIPPDQISQVERDPRFEIAGGVINNTRIICFNQSHPVLANPLIRRALSHSIDRAAIIEGLWSGRTEVPRGLQWDIYGDMDLRDWSAPAYDPAEARRLLREAGYRGEAIPYRALNNYYTAQTPTAQILVEGWRSVGLNVQLQMVENWGQISALEPMRGIRDWSQSAVVNDPSIQMVGSYGRHGAPWISGEWRNEEFGTLAEELERSVDTARRKIVWQRMLQIIERDDPAYTVLHRNAAFTAKRRDIAWRASKSFVMDFRASNWGA